MDMICATFSADVVASHSGHHASKHNRPDTTGASRRARWEAATRAATRAAPPRARRTRRRRRSRSGRRRRPTTTRATRAGPTTGPTSSCRRTSPPSPRSSPTSEDRDLVVEPMASTGSTPPSRPDVRSSPPASSEGVRGLGRTVQVLVPGRLPHHHHRQTRLRTHCVLMHGLYFFP
nr:uncharacterized protein LOC127314542 isoform X2 [Lolium perenne]